MLVGTGDQERLEQVEMAVKRTDWIRLEDVQTSKLFENWGIVLKSQG